MECPDRYLQDSGCAYWLPALPDLSASTLRSVCLRADEVIGAEVRKGRGATYPLASRLLQDVMGNCLGFLRLSAGFLNQGKTLSLPLSIAGRSGGL